MTDTIPSNAIDTNISSRRRKIILLSCCISFLLLLCPGFIRAFSYRNDFWISSTCYFLAVFFIARSNPGYKWTIVRSFALTLLFTGLLIIALGKGHIGPGLIIFPLFMIASVIAIWTLKTPNRRNRYLIIAISSIVYLYMAFWGIDQLIAMSR